MLASEAVRWISEKAVTLNAEDQKDLQEVLPLLAHEDVEEREAGILAAIEILESQ